MREEGCSSRRSAGAAATAVPGVAGTRRGQPGGNGPGTKAPEETADPVATPPLRGTRHPLRAAVRSLRNASRSCERARHLAVPVRPSNRCASLAEGPTLLAEGPAPLARSPAALRRHRGPFITAPSGWVHDHLPFGGGQGVLSTRFVAERAVVHGLSTNPSSASGHRRWLAYPTPGWSVDAAAVPAHGTAGDALARVELEGGRAPVGGAVRRSAVAKPAPAATRVGALDGEAKRRGWPPRRGESRHPV
jgi:hypothetical protein